MKIDPNCVFCKMLLKEIPTNTIYEDERAFAFLDTHPINPGHTLLIPKSHVDHFWNLETTDYHYIMDIAKKISTGLKKTYSPPRVGLVVEGFGVSHTHIHLVPIYHGEDLKKPQPLADPEELKEEAEKIRKSLA